LQKIIVFEQLRRTKQVILIAIPFLIIGILLSSVFVYFITKVNFFMSHQPITKAIVIGMMFFLNYFTRKFSFEGKIYK